MALPNITIAPSIAEALANFLTEKNYSQVAVLSDKNSYRDCLPKIYPVVRRAYQIDVPEGEANKTLETCEHIWQAMTDYRFDRKSLLINLGGGVIGDMGGFCAATYKRGIDFVQIPTTLLAQVDASVGGKLAIDFHGYKNHIGVFQEPAHVFVGIEFLRTLPERELKAGFAEIIKHCLIADRAAWYRLKADFSFEKVDWADWIQHSLQFKTNVVLQDPKESGHRKILNFGHTIGHAVESFFLPSSTRQLKHGEAVVIGMITEGWIAWQRNLMTEAELQEVSQFLLQLYPFVAIETEAIEQIIPLTLQDKKNENQQIQATLIKGIGEAVYNQVITGTEVREALNYYQRLNS
jgi:3-dehydroquinate synthase